MEWVSQVEAKGQMWASPGPYLRQSLLVSLARKVSDLYLPETSHKNTTFLEADGCAQRTEEEEENLAMSLAVFGSKKKTKWRNINDTQTRMMRRTKRMRQISQDIITYVRYLIELYFDSIFSNQS